MSRIEYGEPDDPVCRLWSANAKRALQGRPGQRALREIEAALLAIPDRRLLADAWVEPGQVCALAAVQVRRQMERSHCCWDHARLLVEHAEEEEGWRRWDYGLDDYNAASMLGYTRTLTWEVMEKNDELFGAMTPEQRWDAVRGWVRSQIQREACS